MKKVLMILAATAAIATAFVACSKDEPKGKETPETPVTPDDPDEPDEPEVTTVVIKAALPEALTKVTFTDQTADDKGLALAWAEGDALRVISGDVNEKFTINEGFSGTQAEFTGNIVEGTSFNIIYPGTVESLDDIKAKSYESVTQNGNGSTAHLSYDAWFEGVDDYKDIVFSSDWAGTHNGSFSQNGVLKIDVTVPGGVTTVSSLVLSTQEAIIAADNAGSNKVDAITINFSNTDVSTADQVLTAYINIPAGTTTIPAGAELKATVTDASNNVFTGYLTAPEDIVMTGGNLYNLELAVYPSVYYVSVDGSGAMGGYTADNAISLAQLKALLATVVIDNTDETTAAATQAASNAKAKILDGATFHFADGTYVLTDDSWVEGFKIEFSGFSKQVDLTFEGSENAIISGDKKYRILLLGNQVNLTVNGMSFNDGNAQTAGAEGAGQDGAGICVLAGSSGEASLTMTGSKFSGTNNGTGKSGGAIRCGKGTVNLTNCVFNADNYARNGASIFSNNAAAVVNCTGCTFKSYSYNTGGAANNSGGTQHYTNCTFDGCYTEGGTGGAIHCNNGTLAVVTVDKCTFDGCRVFVNEITKGTTSKSTGIISLQAGDFTVTNSTFKNCEGISGAVILLQNSDAGLFKCSDCLFLNNEGKSRGIIQTNGKNVAFFNNCAFYGNSMTTNQWGLILHGGNPSAACFNNCTFYSNSREQSGGNGVGLNNDGSIIITNSTYIGTDDLVSIRNTNASSSCVLLANDIIINQSTANPYFISESAMKAPVASYNSILGPGYTATSAYTSHNDVTDATVATLTNAAYDSSNHVLTWDGPASTFTKIDATTFETALKSATANNGNTIIDGELGTAFYNWLDSIGALGKDALGTSRGSAWWPGAYQK